MTVYTLILNGRFLKYRDDYQDALEQLCVARDLLDELAKTAETSKDQALATLFSDEISPEIRLCAHELGRSKSYDVDGIVKEIAPLRRKELVEGYEQLMQRLEIERGAEAKKMGKKHLTPLLWEGQEVPVRNPELVDVLLDVQAAERYLLASQSAPEETKATSVKGKPRKVHKSRKGVAAYDGILSALSNAEDIARKLVEAQQVCSCFASHTRNLTMDNYAGTGKWDNLCSRDSRHPLSALVHRLPSTFPQNSARP